MSAAPYAHRLVVALICPAACTLWLYSLRYLNPGLSRQLAALPVLVCNTLVPLLFDPRHEWVSCFLAEFQLTWLCNWKVMAWTLNRGPLSRQWSFVQFAAIMTAPITPADGPQAAAQHKRRASSPTDTAGRMAARGVGKLLFLAFGVWLLKLGLPQWAVELLYALGLYAILSMAMDSPASLVTAALGFRVAPHFVEPWRATSIAEFWSKRWNLVAGNALRDVLYEPVLEGRLFYSGAPQQRPSSWRRFLGMAAVFVGSGFMHELQFWYFRRHWSGGRYGGFFLLQIPAMVLERLAYSGLSLAGGLPHADGPYRLTPLCIATCRRRGVELPRVLRAVITQVFLVTTAHYFFWWPLQREGVLADAAAAVAADVRLVAGALGF